MCNYSISNGHGANPVSVAVSLVGPAKRDGAASVFGFSGLFLVFFFPRPITLDHHLRLPGHLLPATAPSTLHPTSNHCHSLVIILRSAPWKTYAKISSVSSLISPSIYEAVTAPSS